MELGLDILFSILVVGFVVGVGTTLCCFFVLISCCVCTIGLTVFMRFCAGKCFECVESLLYLDVQICCCDALLLLACCGGWGYFNEIFDVICRVKEVKIVMKEKKSCDSSNTTSDESIRGSDSSSSDVFKTARNPCPRAPKIGIAIEAPYPRKCRGLFSSPIDSTTTPKGPPRIRDILTGFFKGNVSRGLSAFSPRSPMSPDGDRYGSIPVAEEDSDTKYDVEDDKKEEQCIQEEIEREKNMIKDLERKATEEVRQLSDDDIMEEIEIEMKEEMGSEETAGEDENPKEVRAKTWEGKNEGLVKGIVRLLEGENNVTIVDIEEKDTNSKIQW